MGSYMYLVNLRYVLDFEEMLLLYLMEIGIPCGLSINQNIEVCFNLIHSILARTIKTLTKEASTFAEHILTSASWALSKPLSRHHLADCRAPVF